MDSKNIGINLLRYSLAFVFLWFGFSQISDITSWIPFVPENLASQSPSYNSADWSDIATA